MSAQANLITWQGLNDLEAAAAASPRLRQHLNLHDSYADPTQRLFNALRRRSYIRPHRHSIGSGSETLIAISGLFAFLEFADDGSLSQSVLFGSELHAAQNGYAAGVEVPNLVWHTVVALTDPAILFEVKRGPFDPNAAKEFASWAPREGSAQAASYLTDLERAIAR